MSECAISLSFTGGPKGSYKCSPYCPVNEKHCASVQACITWRFVVNIFCVVEGKKKRQFKATPKICQRPTDLRMWTSLMKGDTQSVKTTRLGCKPPFISLFLENWVSTYLYVPFATHSLRLGSKMWKVFLSHLQPQEFPLPGFFRRAIIKVETRCPQPSLLWNHMMADTSGTTTGTPFQQTYWALGFLCVTSQGCLTHQDHLCHLWPQTYSDLLRGIRLFRNALEDSDFTFYGSYKTSSAWHLH